MRYGYLLAAALLIYFSGGDLPVGLAAWIYTVFLLRFTRESTPLRGYLIAIPVVTLSSVLAYRGMSPIPLVVVIFSFLIESAIKLLPFLVDRLFYKKLPMMVSIFFFPSMVVALGYILILVQAEGWVSPAYLLQHDLLILQFASIFGLSGITFILNLFATVFNTLWENNFNLNKAKKPVIAFLVIFVLVYSYGAYRIGKSQDSTHSVRVAAITPDFDLRNVLNKKLVSLLTDKEIDQEDMESLKKIFSQVNHQLFNESEKQATAGSEIIAWSEGAGCVFESEEGMLIQKASTLAKEQKVILALGAAVLMDNFQARKKNKTPFVKNKIIMIDKEGKVAWEYLKTRLVPGIETPITIPGDGNFRSLKTQHGVLTGAICYEMDFPEYIRKARLTDAAIMLAPSNDWKEIKNLHAFIATIRAIENGFSLVRPTSGGISLATDPYGRVIGKVDYFISKGSPLVVELPVGKVTTIYSFIGDFFGGLCLIVSIVLIVFSIIKWKRESR